MSRRDFLRATSALSAAPCRRGSTRPDDCAENVSLRVSHAETGFDPAQISDLFEDGDVKHLRRVLLRLSLPAGAGEAAAAAALPEIL